MISNLKVMKPLSIAVVDGVARGGNEFIMACDLVYATENAAFAQPELYINIPTGGQGAVQLLVVWVKVRRYKRHSTRR